MITLLLLACAPYPDGLRATPAGDGPLVKIDWDAKPLPDVPYPTDLATVVDLTSPTGLRLNVPTATITEMERHAREKLNTLSGFGIYSPITVGFTEPLDLANIHARHAADAGLGDAQFADDAFFLIDMTPDSPDYGKPVALDVGSGRYPMDVPDPNRYFPNDSRSTCPSLVFDTVEEDLDGDGILDWGEDTDNDGVLDHPNVWPTGGDPRDDLLSWYEKSTNTLIVRPTRPLREMTTYAMVLTERLVGEDGNPVRSPWEWVHHLRQEEALRPLSGALGDLGLATEDVAFAWVFTTGNVTGDLVDARRGLLGEGPLAAMDAAFEEGVTEALPVHEIDGLDPYRLPVDRLISTLSSLGLFPDESADALVDNYGAFADVLVGGTFTTPNLLGEPGQAVAAWPEVDDSDDYWQVDSFAGTYTARSERVVFTCVLPKNVPQPAPVVMFGHGYGSSRFDFLGFSWAFTRMGYAACAFDYPGHGPTVDPEQEELIETVLGATGLVPFYTHLKDSRFRDLDNDGIPDSGGDQWSADAFHTRDMVRQAALDHAQLVDSFRACGTGVMTRADGTTSVSCDWDGNGTPDLGGPDVQYNVIGGSLGGINAAVAAAVVDEVTAWAPVVPGGGLLDVAVRTQIGGAVEAMHGRILSPLFLGYPTDDGGLRVVQMVNSVTDMVEIPVATLPTFPAGGRVVIENLTNGEVREGLVPVDGYFRLGIPADAVSAWEKRALGGIPATGPVAGAVYTIADPTTAGDILQLSFYDAAGTLVTTVANWETDVTFQGVTFPAGTVLVAAAEGLGHIRGSPELRRAAFVLSAMLEPGDPIAYARFYTEEPIASLGGRPRNVLLMPTPGDSIVNINTGIALARAAGWLDDTEIDARYGTSVDRFLIDRRVVQGLEEFGPYICADGAPCLFDADDLDQGTDGTGATSEAPLRVAMESSSGTSGLRLPYVRTTGTHGFATPEPDRVFDTATFATMQIASYFLDQGAFIRDDLCLESASCAWIPPLPGEEVDTGPVDTGPVDTGPVDTGPVDTGAVDTAPVDTAPVDTAPVDTAAADTSSSDTAEGAR
ncbi:MAG: hypothetical protein Q8P18_14315 [Pseudomonadota bacterium]|nr:hypothetical protein [Pseudomonadota bacterium]